MKTRFLLFSALIALFSGKVSTYAQSSNPVLDTIIMGAGYSNEVYYSMADGIKGSVNRKLWDIAFRASTRSASILTNDAIVQLYTYPKSDTSGWSSVDTAGITSWATMVNSTTDWETGAFNQYQKGHPDYGWGKYNAVTHDLTGDSLFVIVLRDGSFRKLWIEKKYSAENKFDFRYAHLDGSGDTAVTLDCSQYVAKNFIGFSLIDGKVVDYEPVPASTWDILFTKYAYTYPDGVQYPVTGVLDNYDIKVNKFHPVALDFLGFDIYKMDSTRSPIGWEWKSFNGTSYDVVDSLVYFVENKAGNIYKLIFKEFVGSSTGRIVLQKELISLSSVQENPQSSFNLAVYPNPVVDNTIHLVVNPGSSSTIHITLSDITGHIIWNQGYAIQPNELNTLSIPGCQIPGGVYLLRVTSGTLNLSKKVIVQ
jgi:hypothetical protein